MEEPPMTSLRDFWNSIDLDWLTPTKLAALAACAIAVLALVLGEAWLSWRERRKGP
jgi:hypothetical protein